MLCRLQDIRRIATGYDKLARNYLSAVALAAAIEFWLRSSQNFDGNFCNIFLIIRKNARNDDPCRL